MADVPDVPDVNDALAANRAAVLDLVVAGGAISNDRDEGANIVTRQGKTDGLAERHVPLSHPGREEAGMLLNVVSLMAATVGRNSIRR